jgi:hypothetical protein
VSIDRKYAEYMASKAAFDRCAAESPKSHEQRIAELTYQRGYMQGRIDALKEQLGEGKQQ